MKYKQTAVAAAMGMALSVSAGITTVEASSHREAPAITEMPKVDGSDFYMFNSYEAGRQDFVTIIANYQPLQDAYGGPNYFTLDPDALYEIHIDTDGNAEEDITFQFRFNIQSTDGALTIGTGANARTVSVPVINISPIDTDGSGSIFRSETYSINIIRGDRRTGQSQAITDAADGAAVFTKPVDNIGVKSLPDYTTYANNLIRNISIPGCADGRVFVGQRRDGFAVNLGEVFDLVKTNPVGPVDGEANIIANKNVTSIALEIPKSCLAIDGDIIGGWTTASLRQARVLNPSPSSASGPGASVEGGAWTQVSRLGHPLVNEVVIGVKDKDAFNASEPLNDAANFLTYVTHPTLPAILEVLFPVTAPTSIPRNDMVEVFLTGLAGLNQPANVVGSEMLRLNTTTATLDAATQNNLGAIAGDVAGFPNGRRPGDDVVDIALRVVMGALITDVALAPNNTTAFTDGADVNALDFQTVFPYLNTPVAGSIN